MATDDLYVQYGCGLVAPEGWVNFDSSPRLRFERIPGVTQLTGLTGNRLFPLGVKFGDILKGLPIANNSAAGVYASHVLEHVGRNDVPIALSNTYRVLKSGGTFRIIVPDIEWRSRRYLKNLDLGQPKASDEFIESCHIGHYSRPKNAISLLRTVFGNSGHMWMYDFSTMSKCLTDAGFRAIRRAQFNDSADVKFIEVEDRGRFNDGGGNEVAIEAKKP